MNYSKLEGNVDMSLYNLDLRIHGKIDNSFHISFALRTAKILAFVIFDFGVTHSVKSSPVLSATRPHVFLSAVH
jgi:hypothetical protein